MSFETLELRKIKQEHHAMFAQRFDPNAIVEENVEVKVPVIKPRPLIPAKRSRKEVTIEKNEESEVESSEAEISESEAESEAESEVEEEKEDIEKDVDMENPEKFNSVLNRFQQTISLQDKLDVNNEDKNDQEEEVDIQVHDLEQIPQPERTPFTHEDRESRMAATNIAKIDAAFMSTQRIIYDKDMTKPFKDFSKDLDPRLLNNITRQFSTDSFPIQTSLWSNILPQINNMSKISKKNFTRRIGDQLINASTGSGKTLAYSVPLVQSLINRKCKKLRAIVLVPTRLLINQVGDTLLKLCNKSSLMVTMANLDKSLREEHEKLIINEPDILIITPGRLVDHLNMQSISLINLKFLVLDEADRLLNQSFQNWCTELLTHLSQDKSSIDSLPGNIIKMIFSATLTTNTSKLHDLNLYNPKLYMMDSIKLYNLPNGLKEFNLNIGTAKSIYKPLLLFKLIQSFLSGDFTARKVLIFIKSNEAAIRLQSLLSIIKDSFSPNNDDTTNTTTYFIDSINSNNTKLINKKILTNFTQSTNDNVKQILITTDLMSRGIDINNITDVVNYDLPISSQQYVHRVGRTARANNSGNVYNILIGKGEQSFWSNHIDIDLSRNVDTTVDDSISSEVIEQLTSENEATYMECLNIFKQQQQQQQTQGSS